MYYDHADLTRNFDAGTLQRGEDVARKGKVRMARRDDDKLVGEVSGSGGELYRQTVRFRAERGGIGFQGSCSCPMSYNCKHVVALLLADLDHCQHAMARSPAPRPADRRACTCAGRGGARTATSAAPRRSTTSTPCCAHRRHQATDRAWRIGQQQPVFVYKLIARGTLEEKIQELQWRKGELADAVLSNEEETELAPGLQADDLRAIFSLDASPAPR